MRMAFIIAFTDAELFGKGEIGAVGACLIPPSLDLLVCTESVLDWDRITTYWTAAPIEQTMMVKYKARG